MDDEDDSLLDDPFDDADGWWQEDPQEDNAQSELASSILRELGIENYSDVVVDFSNIDASELRGQRFDSIEEAIIYLYDVGILTFSEVVEFDDGTFGYLVTYGETT